MLTERALTPPVRSGRNAVNERLTLKKSYDEKRQVTTLDERRSGHLTLFCHWFNLAGLRATPYPGVESRFRGTRH